ncbi:PAP2-domain-containing protein [Martensiomyces pterosporus]|nr:PAP2-domain-containing protein [Martensiomyces pterosporus]
MAESKQSTGLSLPKRSDIRHFFRPAPEERRRRWKLFKTYIPDWIIVIALNIAGGLFGKLGPRHREFSLHDRTIRYTHHEDYVPNYVPPLVGYAAPILSALAFLVFRRRNWHDFHCTVLGIFLAMGLNNVATNILKNACGRPRPDFIDRCQPNVTKDPPLGLVDYRVCTQTDLKYLHEGMRSFPSGHASLSFCGLTFTALYLASHFRYNDQRGHAYKTVVFYLPLFFAALIAVSRTADYHHHWEDVLAGSALGIYIAWFSYRTYFPPVFSPWILSDRPYPRRIPKPDKLAQMGVRDGHVLPVDEDPYQVYGSSHTSSIQLARRANNNAGNEHSGVGVPSTQANNSVLNQEPPSTVLEIDAAGARVVPDDSPYVNLVRASRANTRTGPRAVEEGSGPAS